MSEVNVELDGKKLWPDIREYLEGELTGIALQTNEELSRGDGIPSVKLRFTVDPNVDAPAGVETQELVHIVADVKIAFLIQVLAAVKGRLEHLESIRQMIASVKH